MAKCRGLGRGLGGCVGESSWEVGPYVSLVPERGEVRCDVMGVAMDVMGRDESERHRAESQWIVAARPLCHLQYPVAYLSRLQRILPAARWELRFKAARTALPPHGLHQRHVPLGTVRSLLRVGKRAAGARVALARILT